ncbi:unnamed protein product [Urochloa humidicola]
MAAHSLLFSLPITRSRAPLALRRLHLPAGIAAAPPQAHRRISSSSSAATSSRAWRLVLAGCPPRRPRAAALLATGGAGRGRRGGELGRRAMSGSTNSSVAAELAVAERSGNVEQLPFVNDKHGGVIIKMVDPMDPGVFSASLKAALAKWREQGIRGVWIKLPITLSNLITPAVEERFWYHHAEETYLMLAYWLPNTTHTLPVNATH